MKVCKDFLGNELKTDDEVLSLYQYSLCVGKVVRFVNNSVLVAVPNAGNKVVYAGDIVKLTSIVSAVPGQKLNEDTIYLGFKKYLPTRFYTFVTYKDRRGNTGTKHIQIYKEGYNYIEMEYPYEYDFIPLSQEYQTLYYLGKD